MKRFWGNERAYEQWLSDHWNEGFVVNCLTDRARTPYCVHRANCSKLHRACDSGRRTVYQKLCSTQFQDLPVCKPCKCM